MNLISALVAVGITSIAALGFAGVMKNSFMAEHRVRNDLDRDALKSMVISAVSCTNTLPSGSCTPGSYVSVYRQHKSGAVSELISKSGTRFGSLAALATCNATGDGLVVKAARLKASASIVKPERSDYLPDPLTGSVTTFSDSKSLLLPSGIELCSQAQSFVRECRKTNYYAPTRGPARPVSLSFSAAECGGTLPDSSYVCTYANQEICGEDQSWTISQPTNTTPPRVSVWWLGSCPAPASPSDIHIVCVKRSGGY